MHFRRRRAIFTPMSDAMSNWQSFGITPAVIGADLACPKHGTREPLSLEPFPRGDPNS